MEIRFRENEGIRIADVEGWLVLGDATTVFRDALTQLLQTGSKQVVLNLAGCDYIDSTGLGSLVVCATSFRKNGGDIKLLNLSRRHMELLVITKLETVFEIFDNEQDAVNSFFPGRQIQHFDILSFVREQERLEDEQEKK
jgi:anti-sigma B factor antagonist